MNKIKLAFKLLQDSGNFEPFQLHQGNNRLWITPNGNIMDFKQMQLAMAVAELFNLLPILSKDYDNNNFRFDLINY